MIYGPGALPWAPGFLCAKYYDTLPGPMPLKPEKAWIMLPKFF